MQQMKRKSLHVDEKKNLLVEKIELPICSFNCGACQDTTPFQLSLLSTGGRGEGELDPDQ